MELLFSSVSFLLFAFFSFSYLSNPAIARGGEESSNLFNGLHFYPSLSFILIQISPFLFIFCFGLLFFLKNQYCLLKSGLFHNQSEHLMYQIHFLQNPIDSFQKFCFVDFNKYFLFPLEKYKFEIVRIWVLYQCILQLLQELNFTFLCFF